MSIFYRGLYKINFVNQSYINAIMQYNSKTMIDAIRFKVLPTDTAIRTRTFKRALCMSQLEEQIRQISSQFGTVQEMEVQYYSANSWAMFDVLQPIHADLYKKFHIDPRSNISPRLMAKDDPFMDYMRTMIFSKTNVTEMAMIGPDLPVCALSREKAIELILKQAKSTDFQCIELPELQTIVFSSFSKKAACFYVTYGDKLNANGLNDISFNIDNGFLFKYEASAKAQQIRAVMQGYFEAWVANNYAGPLFPVQMALGLDILNAPLPALHDQPASKLSASQRRIITRGHPLYQPQPAAARTGSAIVKIHISTDNYADFKALDPRIISTDSWQECSPMRTSVTVEQQHEREIIDLLKTQPGVQFVNDERTEYRAQSQA